MGICPNCGSWIDEGDICSHCGGSGGYSDDDDDDIDEFDNYISRFEYFYRQAKSCSINNDHSTAIGFYTEALKHAYENEDKCVALSSIADEYEAIGDYDSAGEYWNRCCEVETYARFDRVYLYLARKADFLYRRERYAQAIGVYEEALNVLEAMNDNAIDTLKLKYYARITHYLIASYVWLGKDNLSEKYHDVLRHAIARFVKSPRMDNETKAYYLSETAWEAFDGMLRDEALILIDCAIEIHPDCPANDYNRKAIMLERKLRFDEALKYYDKALSKEVDETFLSNKAGCIREQLKNKLLYNKVEPDDLELINKALKILPDSCDSGAYLNVKAMILEQLGEPVKAKVCHALSAKKYDEADKAARQLERLKSTETYINITATQYYKNFTPFREGTIVDLIREPGNPHDRDAIRVDINGETVGYVANSKYTLINEVKSATEIKDAPLTRAEVQFILFNEWVIAKLI